MLISIKYNNLHSSAYCNDRFIWIVQQTKLLTILHIQAIVEQQHVLTENPILYSIGSIYLENNYPNSNINWTG